MYYCITQCVAIHIVSLSRCYSDSWNCCGHLFTQIRLESSYL